MPKLENPVQMAVIGAPHGIRGEVRMKAFTGDPEALGDYGPLQDKDGRVFEISAIRPAKEVAVVRLKGVTTREQAEALTGVALFIDRSALPADLDEGEFYHADLVGLAVEDDAGASVGTIIAIHDFGAGDMLEVARKARPSVMIPFTEAAVPDIDVAAGIVRVDRVAAGLVEEASADDPQWRGRRGEARREEAKGRG